MQRRKLNILVSAAGRRVALLGSFREALDELGIDGNVFAADAQRASSAFHLADRPFLIPPCTDPDFVPTMLEICARWDVGLVIPTIDPELPVWADMVGACADLGTTVAVSSRAAVDIAADKVATNCWLRGRGFPATVQLSRTAALDAPPSAFPMVVKPRRGSSSSGMTVVTDRAGINATAQADQVIERQVPGEEYTIDVLVGRDGRTRCAVPRLRVEVRGGEVSKAVVVRRTDLIDLAAEVCDSLPGAFGPLNVQVIWDPTTDDMRVIEINPRFGGGFPLTNAAGGRFPKWMIEELLELPSSLPDAKWRDGLAMLRYDDAVFIDAAEAGLL